MRSIDADALQKKFREECTHECAICRYGIYDNADFKGCDLICKAPTIEFNETITLDFTNITEEQKQELIKLLSKTRIQAIDRDVIWQNGYDTCLNDKSIRESNWIPVSERLPDKNGNYLCTVDYGEDGIEVMQRVYWDALGGFEKRYNKNDKVIAWMPLPEPYKEDAENE